MHQITFGLFTELKPPKWKMPAFFIAEQTICLLSGFSHMQLFATLALLQGTDLSNPGVETVSCTGRQALFHLGSPRPPEPR